MAATVDFIQDVMNPILDDDPLAETVAIDEVMLSQLPGHQQVVTTHTMVGGVDFLPTEPSQFVARRLLRIGLARLAARGAQAREAVIMLALTDAMSEKWLTRFGEGLAEDMREFNINLVASDVRATRGANLLNLTCIGHVAGKPLRSSGARPGEVLCVSGQIGAAAIGARLAAGERLGIPEFRIDRFVTAHQLPMPPWSIGAHLQSQGLASACRVISSGLISAVTEMARASQVAVKLDLSHLPLADRDLPIGPQINESADYQLLFTVEPQKIAGLRKWFPQVEPIGLVQRGTGIAVVNSSGEQVDLRLLLSDGPLNQ